MTLVERIINPAALSSDIQRPYLIAEAGVNHEGDLDIAYRLIDEAKQGGADAIKFQTYRAESIASKNSPAYWDTTKEPTVSQYLLFKKYDQFWIDEFEKLKMRCDEVEIEFISTPFDTTSASFLNNMMSVFKISSSDITNKPFIENICAYGKPILLSTGASNREEVDEALSWIDANGVPVAIMHCILNYPTKNENANLNVIRGLKADYPTRTIGYSDHTLPQNMKMLEAATLLGAEILEKHFTYDKSLPGNDHYHAMDKNDLLVFGKRMNELVLLLGKGEKVSLSCEELARRNARRSLVAAKDIEKGTVIELAHLTWKRPASGISPKDIDKVIGRIAKRRLARDDILTLDMFA
jgi:N-acetylneuraminate synthase